MLKLSDVAVRLNCSVQNVYSLVETGKLASFRIGATGKGYRVSEDQLRAFLEARREHPGKDVPTSPSSFSSPHAPKHLTK